jgi:mannosyltransferase OCH1-like enzyme
MPRERIQSLWVGTRLSTMERLSIASFLFHGHDYHLFTYGPVEGLPAGVVREDAREVLPESSIFQYRDFASYAGFANFFRYKLLLERGGWWVDTDVVCLRPFDFVDEHVFSTETCRGEEVVTSGVIKAPAGSPVMAYAWEVCQRKNPSELVWGETGPRLMTEAVGRFSLAHSKQPFRAFCPLEYSEWHKVLEPDFEECFGRETYAVHLWNEMWREAGQDKNARYHAACLYERLKRKYLGRRGTRTSL